MRRYVHALRVARPRQLRGRLTRVATRRLFPGGEPPPFAPLERPLELWRSAAFEPVRLAGSGDERLRAFHRHYGEDVLALARAGDVRGAAAAIRGWVDENPPRPGDAWHPYTTATRICSWVAALSLAPDAGGRDVERSLWRQLRHLALNLEDDVLGNHVLRDARALVVGGLAFRSDRLVARGVRLLERELPEQVLADGGHHERSPAYHLVVLRDLLEVRAALPDAVPAGLIERMRGFAAALARPDGAPALFNDGGLDLAPALDLPAAGDGLALLPESGFAVVRCGPLWLAFRCGPLAPDHLPAHAHADALSFQLWWAGSPLVVDPGMPTYEPGPERDRFRGTPAHSTVSLDGASQFEPWGAFRSGPLPRVELLEAREGRLAARVTWPGGAVHERALELGERAVGVADRTRGAREVRSTLPLAPGARLDAHPTGPLAAAREPAVVAERLFERVDAEALVQRGAAPAGEWGWTLRLGPAR